MPIEMTLGAISLFIIVILFFLAGLDSINCGKFDEK